MRTLTSAALLLALIGFGCDDAAESDPPEPTPSEGTCTGVPEPLTAGAPEPSTAGCATCVGELPPAWSLRDVQPQSCGTDETYSINAFRGRPTLLATLSAGCPYCQGQATKLEELRLALDLAGTPVHILTINKASQVDALESLVERCSFPIFQDVEDADGDSVWTEYGAGIGNFYLYDGEGHLLAFFADHPDSQGRIDLTEGTGYEDLKGILIDAMAQ
jgi:hypothetical protein